MTTRINQLLHSFLSFPAKLVLILGVILMTFSFVGSVPTTSAQETQYDPCEVFKNCLKNTDSYKTTQGANLIINLIQSINFLLIYIAAPIAVLFIIFGGFKMVTAGGNDGDVKAGRSMVTNAVLGLILIIISVTIVRVVSVIITGIEIPRLFG